MYGDNVLVRPADRFERGSIALPDYAIGDVMHGTVIVAGPGRYDFYGRFHPVDLKPGDGVIWERGAPVHELEYEGARALIISARFIVATWPGT